MTYLEQYEAWLNDFSSDKALQQELKAIANDSQEIEDRFYTGPSFGTGGMRGVIGYGTNRMNIYVVRRASKGLAEYIATQPQGPERGVVIAYDSRRMSAEFAKETALVLCAHGIKAYLFDSLRPVPVLSFTVRHLGAIAGVEITASHNPPQYNGYKVYWEDGAQLPPPQAEAVLGHIHSVGYADARPMPEADARAAGLLHFIGPEIDDAYIAKIKTLCVQPELMARMGSSLKIVYTPLHGSGNLLVRRVLQEIGIPNVVVVPEQEMPDPNFSTVASPNPEEPSAFALALALAKREGADCVLATDPDCDRVGVAAQDGRGEYVLLSGNQIGSVLLYYILTSRKAQGTLPHNGAVVKTIVTTELARAIATDFGVETFDTLTGFKFIAEKIEEFEQAHSHTYLFGFEESYGYLSSTFVRDKDGVNAALLIAEAAAWAKAQAKTLHGMLMEVYARYGYYLDRVTSLTLPGKDGSARISEMMNRLREHPPAALGDIPVTARRDYLSLTRSEGGKAEPLPPPSSDVLFYELEGSAWACIRPSGTEPKIKLYVNANAKTEQEAAAKCEAILQSLRDLLA